MEGVSLEGVCVNEVTCCEGGVWWVLGACVGGWVCWGVFVGA